MNHDPLGVVPPSFCKVDSAGYTLTTASNYGYYMLFSLKSTPLVITRQWFQVHAHAPISTIFDGWGFGYWVTLSSVAVL